MEEPWYHKYFIPHPDPPPQPRDRAREFKKTAVGLGQLLVGFPFALAVVGAMGLGVLWLIAKALNLIQAMR